MSSKEEAAGRENGPEMMPAEKKPLVRLLFVAIGLILALLSWTDLCSFGGCTEAHEYRFFGLPLPLVGSVFFGLLAFFLLLAGRWPRSATIYALLLAGGAGAELTMINLQNNVIHAWCPLCLGIAVIVYLLSIVGVFTAYREIRRQSTMNGKQFVSRSLLLLVAAIVGFAVSFTGIKKP